MIGRRFIKKKKKLKELTRFQKTHQKWWVFFACNAKLRSLDIQLFFKVAIYVFDTDIELWYKCNWNEVRFESSKVAALRKSLPENVLLFNQSRRFTKKKDSSFLASLFAAKLRSLINLKSRFH